MYDKQGLFRLEAKTSKLVACAQTPPPLKNKNKKSGRAPSPPPPPSIFFGGKGASVHRLIDSWWKLKKNKKIRNDWMFAEIQAS